MFYYRVLFFYFLFFILSFSFAQNEGKIWHFGNNARLDFTGGGAGVLSGNGPILTAGCPVPITGDGNNEGVANICDKTTGQILFTTNGIKVWDKNGTVMPNGDQLWGNNSSTQSSIIVPYPGTTSKFFIFTVDALAGVSNCKGYSDDGSGLLGYGGLSYSIVDLSLNAGLGDVTATKNIGLIRTTTEKLAACKHANGVDYWVVVHKWNSNEFAAFLITSSGINTTPVTSAIGPLHEIDLTFATINEQFRSTVGYMKFSPNSKKIGLAQYGSLNGMQLFDFDNNTGQFSNPIVDNTFTTKNAYGVTFSPDNSKLYISSLDNAIYQYDLNNCSSAAILNSKTLVFNCTSPAAMQIGSDGRIYIAVLNSAVGPNAVINTINNPNALGVACNPQLGTYSWNNSVAGPLFGVKCEFGLPTFIEEYVQPPVSPPFSALISSFNNVTCVGNNNGSATVVSQYGTGPYQYTWSNGAVTATASGLVMGTYTVTVTDLNIASCIGSRTTTTTVTISALHDVAVTPVTSNTTCGQNNGSATINVSDIVGSNSPYTYSWFPNVSSTLSASSLLPGTYTVTVGFNGNTCSKSVTVNIGSSANGPSVNSINPSSVLCKGAATGAISASASGGSGTLSYSWSGAAGNSATVINLIAGIYTVTITDGNACTATSTATITEPAAVLSVNSTVVQNISCFGGNNGSINAVGSGGNGGYSYTWNPGSLVGATHNGLIANTYTVTITDANGCTNTSLVIVNQPASAITSTLTITDAACGTASGIASINSSGGTGGITYSWSNNQNGATINNLIAGNYTVTATDANGCSLISIANINNIGAANIQVQSKQDNKCYGESMGSAVVSASGGNGVLTYSWSNNVSGVTVTNLLAGTYTISVTDAQGCLATSNVVITEPTIVSGTISSTPATCGNSNGTAFVSGIGGVGGYSYLWTTNAITQTVNGLMAGVYFVTITDNNNCTGVQSINIGNSGGATIALQSKTNVSCNMGSDGAAIINSSGGTQPITYTWSNNTSNISINNVLAGVYTVTVSDANNCSSTLAITITEPLPISYTIQTTLASCNTSDGTATVNASGGTGSFLFSWSNNSTTQSINSLSGGNYTVTITDANGCTNSTIVTIGTQAGPTVSIISTNVTCTYDKNGSIDITPIGLAPFVYQWSTNETTQDITNLSVGIYTVTVLDASGCSAITSISILNDGVMPVANYTYNPTYLESKKEVNFINLSSGSVLWNWNFNDPTSGADNNSTLQNPIHTFNDTGVFCIELIAKSISGCLDTTTQCLFVDEDCVLPDSIPNVFSPNGDGNNDEFLIKSKALAELNVIIFNRWGMKLYEYNAVNSGWDGRTFSGVTAPEGTYFYILNAICKNGLSSKQGKGFVQLLR